MKTILTFLVLTFFVQIGFAEERIPFRIDTLSIVDKWEQCPAVPLPTLDHHLGKITASIALYGLLALSGVDNPTAAFIVSGTALTFEVVQVSFFQETIRHSVNDMVLFSYHLPAHLALLHKPYASATLTVSLTGIYLLLL